MSEVECVEVGNWYSEYRCAKCGARWTEQPEDNYSPHDCVTVLLGRLSRIRQRYLDGLVSGEPANECAAAMVAMASVPTSGP